MFCLVEFKALSEGLVEAQKVGCEGFGSPVATEPLTEHCGRAMLAPVAWTSSCRADIVKL